MDIMLELDLNPRHIRVKTFAADNDVKKKGTPTSSNKVQAVISYTIKLRKDAKELAEAVVHRLKQTFSDKTKRRTFLENFWDRVGVKGRLNAEPKSKMRRMARKATHRDVKERMRQVIEDASTRTGIGWDSYTPHTPSQLQNSRSHVVSAKTATSDAAPENAHVEKPEPSMHNFAADDPFKSNGAVLAPTKEESEEENEEVDGDEALSLTKELDSMVSKRDDTDLSSTVERVAEANVRQQHMRNHLARFRARRVHNRRSSFGVNVMKTRNIPGLDKST